jgi:hypothetical protein
MGHRAASARRRRARATNWAAQSLFRGLLRGLRQPRLTRATVAAVPRVGARREQRTWGQGKTSAPSTQDDQAALFLSKGERSECAQNVARVSDSASFLRWDLRFHDSMVYTPVRADSVRQPVYLNPGAGIVNPNDPTQKIKNEL